MKKKILPFLLIAVLSISCSQKFVFNGSLYGYPIRELKQEDNKLYYSFNKAPFDSTQYIIYSDDYSYEYKISLKKIEKKQINEVSFSKNLPFDLNKFDFCIQTFKLQKLKSNLNSKKPKIFISSDMYIEGFNCEETFYYDAKEDGNEWLVGQYRLDGDSIPQTLSLENSFYVFSSKYDNLDSNYMNSEFGRWGYNKENNTLSIYTWVKTNKNLGIILKEKRKYTFKVIKEGTDYKFESDKYKLIKSN